MKTVAQQIDEYCRDFPLSTNNPQFVIQYTMKNKAARFGYELAMKTLQHGHQLARDGNFDYLDTMSDPFCFDGAADWLEKML